MRFFVSTALIFVVAIELISCVQADRQANASVTTDTILTEKGTISNEYDVPEIVRDLDSDSLLATDGILSKINELLRHGTQIRKQEFGGGDCNAR